MLRQPPSERVLLSRLCYPWCLYFQMHRVLTHLILQAWGSITDDGLPTEKEQPLHFGAQLQVSQQTCGACWLSLMLHFADVLLLLRAAGPTHHPCFDMLGAMLHVCLVAITPLSMSCCATSGTVPAHVALMFVLSLASALVTARTTYKFHTAGLGLHHRCWSASSEGAASTVWGATSGESTTMWCMLALSDPTLC